MPRVSIVNQPLYYRLSANDLTNRRPPLLPCMPWTCRAMASRLGRAAIVSQPTATWSTAAFKH